MSAAPRLAEAEIPVDPVQGLDELPYGFIAVGFDLTISYASHGAHELLGYEPGDLVGRSAVDRLDPDDFDRILGLFEQLTDDADRRRTEPSSARHVELSLRLLDGHDRWLSIGATGRLLDREGPFFLMLRPNQVDRSMGELVRGMALGHSTSELVEIVTNLVRAQFPGRDAWVVSRLDASVPLARGTTALPPSIAVAAATAGAPVRSFEAGGSGQGGYWAVAIDDAGGHRVGALVVSAPPGELHPTPYDVDILQQDAQVASLVLRREIDELALQLAMSTDQLTGADNRGSFQAAVADLGPDSLEVAVLYVDLDRFKAINDRFGHACGDRVLRNTVERIRASIRSEDLLARLGGDEFAVLCRRIDHDDAQQLLRRVRASLNDRAHPGERHGDAPAGAPVGCGASVGMATATSPSELNDLIERADAAMYAVKHADFAGG